MVKNHTEERTGTVFNSTLKRKTPLRKSNWSKAKKPDKSGEFRAPRKPLKKVSKARNTQLRHYYEIRKDFLRENPRCAVCLLLDQAPAVTAEIHHIRGRRGPLLCDTRFFLALDSQCHRLIHENASWAREQGLLASLNDWNRTAPKNT